MVWKNKLLFALLLVLQIIFFIAFIAINFRYTAKMVESQKAIDEYISSLRLDEESVASNMLQQKNILGDDPLLISRNFNEIVKNFRIYLAYIFVLLIFFISISWVITNKLIYKASFSQLRHYFFRVFVVSLFYLGLIFAFFYSLLNISLIGIAAESSKLLTKYVPFLVLSIALLYFMFISIPLLHKASLRNIVQKTLILGIKKIHYVLAVYLINIFLFGASAFLLYYFIEKNLFVLLLSLILMLFSFVFGRIFLAKAVEELIQ